MTPSRTKIINGKLVAEYYCLGAKSVFVDGKPDPRDFETACKELEKQMDILGEAG